LGGQDHEENMISMTEAERMKAVQTTLSTKPAEQSDENI